MKPQMQQQQNMIDQILEMQEFIKPGVKKNPYGDLFGKDENPQKLVFNNERKDEIKLDELMPGYEKKIEFGDKFHNIRVSVDGDSIYVFIVEGAPGEQCICCHGSGRKP
ncbi:hypothetical protein D3H65_03765 [Paraflavitalea soli]|uniref:Uncharacterized protein n=1 Tax=Paraflavitalea soli TaxID=2315862 RepID=A0A3B7MRF0_9BACT|nr:hypothetical protein [Paraflavitalea soli]AXY73141.1 hypothetical protein D3H65_03765 [Paraflavitalea soli]